MGSTHEPIENVARRYCRGSESAHGDEAAWEFVGDAPAFQPGRFITGPAGHGVRAVRTNIVKQVLNNHAPNDPGGAAEQMRVLGAARCAGARAEVLIRIAGLDPVLVKRAMGISCQGIIVPNVNTAEYARLAVRVMPFRGGENGDKRGVASGARWRVGAASGMRHRGQCPGVHDCPDRVGRGASANFRAIWFSLVFSGRNPHDFGPI